MKPGHVPKTVAVRKDLAAAEEIADRVEAAEEIADRVEAAEQIDAAIKQIKAQGQKGFTAANVTVI